jgi:heme exporter protein A
VAAFEAVSGAPSDITAERPARQLRGGPGDASAERIPAIELDGVSKRFGREMVLRELRLEMGAGRVAVLRGSNGAGKTTLLRMLATRLRPTRGHGRVFGFDLQRQGDEVRRRVALVSVLGGNYPVLTARENLKLAATLSGLPGNDLDAALARVGLDAAADTLVRTFSSGMKKRLGLARLLLLDPPLWLMDEPYAALDEDGKNLLDEVLTAARGRARTVLMASHELERSARFADAVLELAGGALRRSGS